MKYVIGIFGIVSFTLTVVFLICVCVFELIKLPYRLQIWKLRRDTYRGNYRRGLRKD